MGRLGPWAVLLAVMLGILGGLGAFTFGYGDGASYLSNDPTACTNCHVMQESYDQWVNSSHSHVATCNDCHLPHDTIGKWVAKADHGFFHSLAFTTGEFHEPIRAKERSAWAVQQSCLHCHSDYVNATLPHADTIGTPIGTVQSCVSCHSDVGHAHR